MQSPDNYSVKFLKQTFTDKDILSVSSKTMETKAKIKNESKNISKSKNKNLV